MINHVIPTKVGIQRRGEEHPPTPLTLREGGICTSPSLQPDKTDDGDASERSEIAWDAGRGWEAKSRQSRFKTLQEGGIRTSLECYAHLSN